jgi:hypothetical protein
MTESKHAAPMPSDWAELLGPTDRLACAQLHVATDARTEALERLHRHRTRFATGLGGAAALLALYDLLLVARGGR